MTIVRQRAKALWTGLVVKEKASFFVVDGGGLAESRYLDSTVMMKSKRLWEERFLPTEKGWGLFDISLDPGKQILLVAAFEKGLHRFQLDPIDGGILEKQQIKEKAGHLGNVIKVAWHPSGKRFATCKSACLNVTLTRKGGGGMVHFISPWFFERIPTPLPPAVLPFTYLTLLRALKNRPHRF